MDLYPLMKADTADDADPRVTAPDTARVFDLAPYCDMGSNVATASAILSVAVLNNTGGASGLTRCADGSAVLTLYAYDGKRAVWLKVDSSTVLLNDQVYSIGFPPALSVTRVFVQVTSVVGTGKDHVQVGIAPGGMMPNDVNVGDVSVQVGGAPAAGADGVANPTLGRIFSFISGFNGTTWDRLRTGFTAATSTLTGYLNTLPQIIFNTTTPTPTNGQAMALQADAAANLKSTLATKLAGEDITNDTMKTSTKAQSNATDAWASYAATAKVGTVGIAVKASAGRLRQIKATNSHATASYWLLVCNKATAPVANDLPVWAIELPAAPAAGPNVPAPSADFGEAGFYLATGFSYAISTTSEKVTLPASADCMVYANYL